MIPVFIQDSRVVEILRRNDLSYFWQIFAVRIAVHFVNQFSLTIVCKPPHVFSYFNNEHETIYIGELAVKPYCDAAVY